MWDHGSWAIGNSKLKGRDGGKPTMLRKRKHHLTSILIQSNRIVHIVFRVLQEYFAICSDASLVTYTIIFDFAALMQLIIQSQGACGDEESLEILDAQFLENLDAKETTVCCHTPSSRRMIT